MSVNNMLSQKEWQCLYLAAQDFTTQEASEKLHRTIDTIKKHRMMILRKLGCNTMAGAVMLGITMRLFEQEFDRR
jgi:DNA-binding CsgD family transcriptional regulator